MKRKVVWLVVSCSMVAALLLASCAPAAVPEEEEKPAAAAPATKEEDKEAPPQAVEEEVATEGKEMVRDSLGRLVEKPEYGGTFTYAWSREPLYFDQAFGLNYYAITQSLTNEALFQGDWAKGPSGTKEASWVYNMDPTPDTIAPALADSWELVDDTTIVYHIRKGIYFHDKPPVNGREMDANDVAFSLNRMWQTPGSYHYIAYSWDIHGESIEATDKWTVVLKTKPGMTGRVYRFSIWYSWIIPHEVVDEYGDLGDWRNSNGTGAFMLTDYVSGSSVTFVRNPNYWMKDPLHLQNQLPYVSGVKYLVIVDVSTRLAALRTGKVDSLQGLTGALNWEDTEQLMKTNPELQWAEAMSGGAGSVGMRVDNPELPWYDKKVRQALAMAVDNQAIADSYYGGKAEVYSWPVLHIPDFADMWVPFEELSASIREQYEYHPDKAKEMLAEAGYPDGFKAEVIAIQVDVDMLSIIQDYWSKIGVDLKIDVREYGAYTSILYKRAYTEMIYGGTNPTVWATFSRIQKDQGYNYSVIDDPVINEAWAKVSESYFDEAKKRAAFKAIVPHVLEQAYMLVVPTPLVFTPWQPWIKSYSGETAVGSLGQMADFIKYVWVDQDLKEAMTGKR